MSSRTALLLGLTYCVGDVAGGGLCQAADDTPGSLTSAAATQVVELRSRDDLAFRFFPRGTVTGVLTSPDSAWLAIDTAGVTPRMTRLWRLDSDTDADVQYLLGGSPWAFSADSGLIATTIRGPTMRLSSDDRPEGMLLVYDTAGRPGDRVKGTRAIIELDHAARQVLFVRDSVVSVDDGGNAHFFNVATATLEKKLPWEAVAISFDPAADSLVVATARQVVALDPHTGTERSRRPIDGETVFLRHAGDGESVVLTLDKLAGQQTVVLDAGTLETRALIPDARALAVLPGGLFAARSSATGAVRLHGTSAGEVLRTLRGDVDTLHASADGRLLLEVADGVIALRDPASFSALAYWMAVPVPNTSQTFAVTRDGLFDGHHSTWGNVEYLVGPRAESMPGGRFARDFYRPGLLRELLAGRLPKPGIDIATIDLRVPTVEIRPHGEEPMFSDRRIEIAIEVGSAPNGARDLRLLRNGLMIRRWRGAAPIGEPLVVDVAVSDGDNRFTAHAFSNANVKSNDAEHTHVGVFPPPRRTASIVAIGVDRYRSLNDLRYAVSDAKEFAARLQTKLRRAGSRVRGRWQSDWDDVKAVVLENEEFSRDTLIAAIGRLGPAGAPSAAGPSKLRRLTQSGPDDAVFLFFAGHGVLHDEHFFMLPHDAETVGDAAPRRGISDEVLDEALESIDARHIVLVIDSCHSGQVLSAADDRLGLLNTKGLAQLAYEKGMHILAASQSYQVAHESSALGHGLLTSALIEGLGTLAAEADREPDDGQVDLDEWLAWAAERVPIIHDGLPEAGRGIGIVSASSAAPEPRVQRPRVYSAPRLVGRSMTISRVASPAGRR